MRKNHGVFRSGKKGFFGGREEARVNLSFSFFYVMIVSSYKRDREEKS